VDGSTRPTLAALLDDGLFADGDWVESKDQDPNGEVRLIQLADIGDGVFRNRSSRYLAMSKAKELRCTFLQPGDVLVARMPEPLGRACMFPDIGQPAVTAVDVCILRPNHDRARPEWLVCAINSPGFRIAMQAFVRGTTRQRISRKNMGTLLLHVPPVQSQLDLAASVDRILVKRDRAADHIVAGLRAIDQLRQSVLAFACSGRLTTDWRNSLNQESIDDVPGTWMLRTVESLAAPIPRAIQSGPFGSNLKHSEFQETGRLVIGIDNVRDGNFSLGSQHRISDAKFAELQKYQARPGDVLITVMATIGRVCVVPDNIEPAIITKHVYRITVDRDLITPSFLMRALQGHPTVRAQIRSEIHGQTRPGINGQVVKALQIAVPPLAEQDEIVRRVDRMLALADRLTERLERASQRVERTSHAVLAKAFSDEPRPNGSAVAA
jgi:type I restriction enzyme, S subunit